MSHAVSSAMAFVLLLLAVLVCALALSAADKWPGQVNADKWPRQGQVLAGDKWPRLVTTADKWPR